MKLHLEQIRYGEEAEIPFQKRGRQALLLRAGARHVDIMADENEEYDLETVTAALDALKRRGEVVAHVLAEGISGAAKAEPTTLIPAGYDPRRYGKKVDK